MKVLELFAGTGSVGKAFREARHEVYTIDWNKELSGIDWCVNIMSVEPYDILIRFGRPDIIWASPDCTTYSLMAISKHRKKNNITGELEPISSYAKFCDAVNKHMLELIWALNPKYWFIENPRAGLRKMLFMQGLPRYTITYCQYGDMRMKPTDIWTNHPNPNFKPPCKRNSNCHVYSPRWVTVKRKKLDKLEYGGTQYSYVGKNAKIERSKIPVLFCKHIVDICEKESGENDRP